MIFNKSVFSVGGVFKKMETTNLCLLCSAPGLQVDLPQLRTFSRDDPFHFLFHEVLNFPEAQCQRILEATGVNQEDGLSMCFPCSEGVIRAVHLQQWLFRLPEEMERVRGALRDKFMQNQEKDANVGGGTQLPIRRAFKSLITGRTAGPEGFSIEVTRSTLEGSPQISTTSPSVIDVSSINVVDGYAASILQTTLEQHAGTSPGEKRKKDSTINLSDSTVVSSTSPEDGQQSIIPDEEDGGGKRRRLSQRLSQSFPENCEICEIPISSYYDYMAHKRDHEDPDCVARFSCEYCKFVGKDLGMLRKHRQDFHHIQKSQTKKFSCDKCPYTTTTAGYLSKHKRTHEITDNFEPVSGSKLFRCKICGHRNAKLKMYKHVREEHLAKTNTGLGVAGANESGPPPQQLLLSPDQPSSSAATSTREAGQGSTSPVSQNDDETSDDFLKSFGITMPKRF